MGQYAQTPRVTCEFDWHSWVQRPPGTCWISRSLAPLLRPPNTLGDDEVSVLPPRSWPPADSALTLPLAEKMDTRCHPHSLGSTFPSRIAAKMAEVIDLFREHDTRDELGLGVICDALADLLFPGTSTLQTRAR